MESIEISPIKITCMHSKLNTSTGWVEDRSRLFMGRKTWGCWWTKRITQFSDVLLQPIKPTVSWAASKEGRPAGQWSWFFPSSLLQEDPTWSVAPRSRSHSTKGMWELPRLYCPEILIISLIHEQNNCFIMVNLQKKITILVTSSTWGSFPVEMKSISLGLDAFPFRLENTGDKSTFNFNQFNSYHLMWCCLNWRHFSLHFTVTAIPNCFHWMFESGWDIYIFSAWLERPLLLKSYFPTMKSLFLFIVNFWNVELNLLPELVAGVCQHLCRIIQEVTSWMYPKWSEGK